MSVTIVVGGQYGSEGKGKVIALIARSKPIGCVVCCGGPNSGHTTSIDGQDVVLRQLPFAPGQSITIDRRNARQIDWRIAGSPVHRRGGRRGRFLPPISK